MLDNLKKYKIILASNSPRRRELLGGLGVDFQVRIISGIDESYPAELQGEQIPQYIAEAKAAAYRTALNPDELVITADTVVWKDRLVLGKPKDESDAKRMLHLLSGGVHQVSTGVCVSTIDSQKSFVVTTDVRFATLSEEEIDFYVKQYRPMDKAGAYGIQEWIGFVGVESIRGSYFNVMGLPVQRLYKELLKF